MSTQDTAGTAREGMTMDTEHGEIARLIGDLQRAERERDAATERAGRAEAQHATVLASLEHALAQGDALNAEAKAAHDRAAAAEVRATVAERVRDDLRVIAERQVDDIEGATVRIRRIERERDDLAATLETRNAEHALAMARVAEMEAERDAWRRTAESGAVSLADLKVLGEDAALVARRVRAEVMHLRAIIAGRTTPPTDAEIAAHAAAGGSWHGMASCDRWGPQYAAALRDVAKIMRWWPLDAEGRPCAWPTAEVSRG